MIVYRFTTALKTVCHPERSEAESKDPFPLKCSEENGFFDFAACWRLRSE